jgi:hypothetical protein
MVRWTARSGRSDGVGDAVGRGFARLTLAPAIGMIAWLVPGLPLLLAGEFLPVPMLLIGAPLAAALAVNVLHRVPCRWPAELPGPARDRSWMSWWAMIGTVAVAAGFTAWQLAQSSPSLIVSRTPGVYFQTGYWIAQHGSLPISQSLAAFGGPQAGLHWSSIGFFQAGHSIVPAVTAGLPMLITAGFWTTGMGGGAVVGPVIGGLAVLSFGGLVGRLAGRQWAPAGALVLALTLPELYTSRDSFSETAVQVLLFGSLSLVIDALTLSRDAELGEQPRSSGTASPALSGSAQTASPTLSEAADAVPPARSGSAQTLELTLPGSAEEAGAARSGSGSGSAGSGSGSADAVGPGSADAGIAASAGSANAAGSGSAGAGMAGAGMAGAGSAGSAASAETLELTLPGVDGGSSRRKSGWWRIRPRRRIGSLRQIFSWRLIMARLRRITWRGVASLAAGSLTPERIAALLGGLSLGLSSLLSPGSLVLLLPAIGVAGVLVAARRAVGVAFCIGILIGTGYGIAGGYLLARPLMDSLAPRLEIIGAIAAGLTVAIVAALRLLRSRRISRFALKSLARRPLRWLPGLGGAAVIAGVAGLAIRPYLQTVRGRVNGTTAHYVAALQQAEHLRIDPTRLYAEDTLYWVIWYAGITAVLLGAFGCAALVRRCLRAMLSWQDPSGARMNWALGVAVLLGGSAAILWQPYTVPDQPWASRRLVPAVIPGLILFATWTAAWLTRRARERGAGSLTAAAVGVFCVGAMLLPSVSTSFGVGLTHSGAGGGLRPSAGGLAQHRVAAGESDAVSRLCASIGRSSSVVILDRRIAQMFSEVIRGICGVPVAWVAPGTSAVEVNAVLGSIVRARRRPVVLGATPGQVAGYGGQPMLVLNLVTTQDSHELTQAPGAPWSARYVIWMTAGSSLNVGV